MHHALKRPLTVATAAALAITVSMLAFQQPAATAQDDAVNAPADGVGVIDFGKLQSESAFVKALQAELQAAGEAAGQELQQAQATFQEDVKNLQLLADGSEQRLERERELGERRALLEYRQQALQQEVGLRQNDANLKFFDLAEQAIAEVAEARGLAVVIRKNIQELPDDRARLRRVAPNELVNLFQGQTTLYVASNVDITSEVVEKLDAAAGGE